MARNYSLNRTNESNRSLRQKRRVNYYEPEEPCFDEYEFCEECSDYVFEYCAIHGPLLVIPDDKVPPKPNFPAVVPRAALTIPHVFLHLAPSLIPGAGIGVFSTLTVPRGVRFGPYRGLRADSVDDSVYCWQIYDRNNKRSHVVDAADSQRSNWMRYVNCARHWSEQNLVAYQYKGQLYYRTIKIIPRFTELLVFYGSEFANALNINLTKYNSTNYCYYEIRNTLPITSHGDESNSRNNSSEDTTQSNREEEFLNFNDFQIKNNIESTTSTRESFIDEISMDINANKQFSIKDETFNEYNSFDGAKIQNNVIHTNFVENDSITINFQNLDTFNSENKTALSNESIKFQCNKCPKYFKKKRGLNEHLKRHSENPKFQCPECPYKTCIKFSYKRHCRRHNNRPIYNCDLCSFKTDNKYNLVRHTFEHNIPKFMNTKSYYSKLKQCELCEFNTYSRASFRTHMLKHRGTVYQCHLCEYKNYSKVNLTHHFARRH